MKHSVLATILCGALALAGQAQTFDLSGKWRFAVDRSDQGVTGRWFETRLTDEVSLPGSMLTNGKGDPVNLQTPWVGSINDRSFFTSDFYAPYRTDDNFKIPTWLQPDLYYRGVAWYQRDVEIPASWSGKTVELQLERCHWETRVWVDGREAGMRNALGAPHNYDLTRYLTPGRHTLSIRVDNSIRTIDPGENSHSVSDHTQGNWNGMVGYMRLVTKNALHFSQVDVYPDVKTGVVRVRASVDNAGGTAARVTATFNLEGKQSACTFDVPAGAAGVQQEVTVALPEKVRLWDEFNPNLYRLSCRLQSGKDKVDEREVTFGCRTWSVENGQLMLNGHPAFMRGALDCAAFPLTGYPPTDKKSWMRELRICRDHGINHIRFHSWCPPEAAFEAADELGMYFMIECSSWANQSTTIGDGGPLDAFIHNEAEAIVDAFGNHPSFCMMAYGNEPAGNGSGKYLADFVNYWRQRDARRLYTSASGWPNLPENDFLSDGSPRIQPWGAGLSSCINAQDPNTMYDWSSYAGRFKQPIISHEIGQWCVYPNFKEMKKYTGVYKPRNFEIFQETLEKNGMAQLADSFLLASGKLQTLCYKADIEAALRTPKFGGFQLLGLNDFPGQGTALVGSLDVFWEEKGYVSPEEYSRFCNALVPLARIPRLVMTNADTLRARIEVANFYKAMEHPDATWRIRDTRGRELASGRLGIDQLPLGNGLAAGEVLWTLQSVTEPSQLNLEVTVAGYSNDWDFWVYPAQPEADGNTEVWLTDTLDARAMTRLEQGGKVLLSLRKGALSKDMGGDVAIGFSSIFWNTAWTARQPPHSLGILCNPKHPALAEFPTEYFSNYQWWDAMSHSGAIRFDRLSADIQPIVRVIDDWVTARPLALLFEAKVGRGKLLISGIDFHADMGKRPAARQLLHSLKQYMQTDSFRPQVSLDAQAVRQLTR